MSCFESAAPCSCSEILEKNLTENILKNPSVFQGKTGIEKVAVAGAGKVFCRS